MPDGEYFQRGLDEVVFSSDIDPIIESFVSAHLSNSALRYDTERHENSSREIRRMIFDKDVDALTKQDMRQALDRLMGKDINKGAVMQNDLRKIKAFMRFIREFPRHGDPLVSINRLIRNGTEEDESLHLDGAGPFFVTQLLAAAHPKEYVVLEKNVAEGLRDLNITSIFVQPNTANGYLFINDVCKKLYREKIQPALKKEGLNYGHWAVHNFLWHYNAYYKATKRSWVEK